MNYKTAKIITLLFGIALIITSSISMYHYSTCIHTTAVITAVDNIKEMYGCSKNPLYRDYYEENTTVTYDSGKTGNLVIKGRFKQQLPAVGDTVPVFVSKSGKITEKTTQYIIKPCFMMLFGIFLVILGIKDKKKGKAA